MAEYCAQCAKEYNMNNGMKHKNKNAYVLDVCEGCGVIQVNYKGECVSDCDKMHGDNSGEVKDY